MNLDHLLPSQDSQSCTYFSNQETIEEYEAWCRQERRKNIDYCKQRLIKALEDLGDEALRIALAELSQENKTIRYAVKTAAAKEGRF